MSHIPVVSVIIPCYNYARFLPLAIESVLRQEGSGFTTEIIVVDDGSTDATPEVGRVLGSRIKYIRQENQGLSGARNTGMDAASGDFLLFLDADDLLSPSVIARHLDHFAACPELDISVCRCVEISLDDNYSTGHCTDLFGDLLPAHLCAGNIAPVHALMIRTAFARRTGYFDTSLTACEDYDFWLRCAASGATFGITPNGLVLYRKHGESMSASLERQIRQNARVLLRARKFLESDASFPLGHKRLGWLGQAWGCLLFACWMEEFDRTFAHEMNRHFCQAVYHAARAPYSPSSPLLEKTLSFYAINILNGAEQYAFSEADEQVSMVQAFQIVERLFPRIRLEQRFLNHHLEQLRQQLYLAPGDAITQLCQQQGITLTEE